MRPDSRARRWAALSAWVLLMAACAPAEAFAQGSTPIPDYTGDRVYVKDVPDRYEALSQTIKELERSSPQTYFVVVVKNAGSGPDATRNYVDRLTEVWTDQAQKSGLKLDPDRSVITVAALDNRQVAVHTGSLLRQEFGLRGKTIEDELVKPIFIPLARDGKYPEAIQALLTGVHNWLASKDPATTAVKSAAVPAIATRGASNSAKPMVPGAGNAGPAGRTSAGQAVPPARSSTYQRDATLAFVGSLLAIGLILSGLFWWGRRRQRNDVEAKIKQYRTKAVDMMDRLDALKNRLKRLPTEDPDFKEPMSGDTLTLYQQCQGDMGKLWDRWLEIMDALDKAKSLAGKDSPLGIEKTKEAEKLVSDSKIFEEVEAQAQACSVTMDRLNLSHEEAREAAKVLTESRTVLRTRIEQVDGSGLPTVPYQPDLVKIEQQAKQASDVLTPDPIGARSGLEQARNQTTALRDRVDQVLARFEDSQQLEGALATLKQQVAGLRQQGLRLDEDGGNPDHPVSQALREGAELVKSVRAGDPGGAARHLESGRSLLEQARQIVVSVQAARSGCDREATERVRETQRLREALGPAETAEAELKREFAPASWQQVDSYLAKARALLETFDRKAKEAGSAGNETAQKYLLGSRLYSQLNQEQQVVRGLTTAIGDQLRGLKAVRNECTTLRREIEIQDRRVGQFFAQNRQVVGAMARQSLASAQQGARQVLSEFESARPDWPAIRQTMARAVEEFAIAQSQAEEDVKTYRQLTVDYDQTKQEANRIKAFLLGHEEDRLAANQHYQSAEDALRQVEAESTRPEGEWARLLEQVHGAGADLDASERLAKEDIRLARQAEAEIQEAARTIRKARTFFSMGVTLTTATAEAQLSQAEQLYRSQNYEQSIRTAGAAIRDVRQAHNVAMQQAFWRQMQIQAEQRRQIASSQAARSFGMGAAIGAAAAAASAMGEGVASAADGFSAVVGSQDDYGGSAGSDSDGSSSTSWASESSESNW